MRPAQKESVIIALVQEFGRCNERQVVNCLVRRWWQMDLADLCRLLHKVRKIG